MKYFRLFPLLLLVVNCKGARDNTSEPEFVQSEDGRLLTVALGSNQEGYCVLTLNEQTSSDAELLTTSGALTKRQLGTVMRYMGIPETLIVGTVATATAVLARTMAVSSRVSEKLIKEADSGGKALAKLGIVAVAIYGTIHAGKVVYRVIRGGQEGEDTKSRIVGGLFGGMILGPVVELIRRGNRVDKVVNDKEIYKVSNKKMELIIERVKAMPSDFAGQCDHLR